MIDHACTLIINGYVHNIKSNGYLSIGIILKINVTNTYTLKNIFNAFTILILRNMRILRITIFDDKKLCRPKYHQTCWMSLYWLSANHMPPLSKEEGKSQLWRKKCSNWVFFLLCTSLAIIVFMLICEISRNQTLIHSYNW